uniref:Acidic leucine-rich nuclear phosphoprotein 32-related protein 2-like n=1 Tax=Bursaphelenchus xylophilus TaxID=6326 RepID=A0A1I7RX97_BURXY
MTPLDWLLLQRGIAVVTINGEDIVLDVCPIMALSATNPAGLFWPNQPIFDDGEGAAEEPNQPIGSEGEGEGEVEDSPEDIEAPAEEREEPAGGQEEHEEIVVDEAVGQGEEPERSHRWEEGPRPRDCLKRE